MSKATKIILALAAVAAIVLGAAYLFGAFGRNGGNEVAEDVPPPREDAVITMTYREDGFDPSRVTIKPGDAIEVRNESDAVISPAADPGSETEGSPELDFGDIEPGENEVMIIHEEGEWEIRNRHQETHSATIVVE